jgi:hypothetical protein
MDSICQHGRRMANEGGYKFQNHQKGVDKHAFHGHLPDVMDRIGICHFCTLLCKITMLILIMQIFLHYSVRKLLFYA